MTPWDDKQFHWHLTTRRFGRQVRYFEELDSTNRWLSEHLEEFSLTGAAVVCGHQTAGRGRESRVWLDVPGNALLCSVYLRLTQLTPAMGLLSMLPAIALARCIVRHDKSAAVMLKWPNDVLIGTGKIAGILSESRKLPDHIAVIIGVGVNIGSLPQHIAPGLSTVPASLADATTWHPAREILLADLLNELEPLFDLYLNQDYATLRDRWLEFGPSLGTSLQRERAGKLVEGAFRGLTEYGHLLLELSSGEVIEIHSGDVELA